MLALLMKFQRMFENIMQKGTKEDKKWFFSDFLKNVVKKVNETSDEEFIKMVHKEYDMK